MKFAHVRHHVAAAGSFAANCMVAAGHVHGEGLYLGHCEAGRRARRLHCELAPEVQIKLNMGGEGARKGGREAQRLSARVFPAQLVCGHSY